MDQFSSICLYWLLQELSCFVLLVITDTSGIVPLRYTPRGTMYFYALHFGRIGLYIDIYSKTYLYSVDRY